MTEPICCVFIELYGVIIRETEHWLILYFDCFDVLPKSVADVLLVVVELLHKRNLKIINNQTVSILIPFMKTTNTSEKKSWCLVCWSGLPLLVISFWMTAIGA